jgi:MFS transporter, CP family, cyanate transporter
MRARRPGAEGAWLLVGVLVAGFNLQLAIVAVGPLIDDIRLDTGISSATAGLLQTVPFLCIGLTALAGPALVAAIGAERMVGYALVVICAGAAARTAVSSPGLLLAASVPLGLGSGALMTSLPAIVKTHFSGRSGAVIGAYTAALSVGAALAALTAVPLSHGLDSWRLALAVDAVPAAIALPIWLAVARPHYTRQRGGSGSQPALRSLLRPPAFGLRLAALFACQSVIFTAMISWVATLYRDHGWSDGRAGVTTAVISLVTIPAALLLPGRSDGMDRRPWLIGTALALSLGTFGIALAPTASPWMWLVIFGVGTGAIFPLCLALPLDLTDSEAGAARLTAWMLGFGYVVSAGSPTAVGGLRDLTGDFAPPMTLLGVIALLAALLASSSMLRPRRSFATAHGEPAG